MRISDNSSDLQLCIGWDGCTAEVYKPAGGQYQNLELSMKDAYCKKSNFKGSDGATCQYSG